MTWVSISWQADIGVKMPNLFTKTFGNKMPNWRPAGCQGKDSWVYVGYLSPSELSQKLKNRIKHNLPKDSDVSDTMHIYRRKGGKETYRLHLQTRMGIFCTGSFSQGPSTGFTGPLHKHYNEIRKMIKSRPKCQNTTVRQYSRTTLLRIFLKAKLRPAQF